MKKALNEIQPGASEQTEVNAPQKRGRKPKASQKENVETVESLHQLKTSH
jgi:hypothetical protein